MKRTHHSTPTSTSPSLRNRLARRLPPWRRRLAPQATCTTLVVQQPLLPIVKTYWADVTREWEEPIHYERADWAEASMRWYERVEVRYCPLLLVLAATTRREGPAA